MTVGLAQHRDGLVLGWGETGDFELDLIRHRKLAPIHSLTQVTCTEVTEGLPLGQSNHRIIEVRRDVSDSELVPDRPACDRDITGGLR